VRAAWLPGRLLYYVRTRAAYWRYARLLETCAADASWFRQAFPQSGPEMHTLPHRPGILRCRSVYTPRR
ncbi:MAG: hypothetical protein ACE5JM_15760, partial [Armatimonadota bacterium]